MARYRNKEMLTRALGHVAALAGVRRGLRVQQLIERSGCSRATVYRDLQMLMEAGIPVASEQVNGEMRYSLDFRVPPVQPTMLQCAALLVARQALKPLEGTRLLKELDSLVRSLTHHRSTDPAVAVEPTPTAACKGQAITRLEAAIDRRGVVEMRYFKIKGSAPETRRIEPCEIRMHGNQVYLVAFDLDREDYRTFKLSRITEVELTEDSARNRDQYDPQLLFQGSVGVWTGPEIDVVIYLSPGAARFVQEWPLSSEQQVQQQSDGSSILRARVAGTLETMRWVLRWGKNATVMEPVELRQQVHEELCAACASYSADNS